MDGKELAIYKDSTLLQWNVYGLDNVGKLVGSKKYYYMKDHLGSVRALLDEDRNTVSAQDYDMWGYILDDRTYESDESIYKFTSKERDEETTYDYFGARYYDSRIGRWGQIEPLLDEFPQFSPYNYSLNNPIRIIDDDGNGPKDGIKLVTNVEDIRSSFNEIIDRISIGLERLSSGDVGGAIQQMGENIIESPRLIGGLIPGDFTTDFILPLGMARQSTKLLKLSEGVTINKQAQEIAKFINKNRINIGYGELDLAGNPHYSKILQKYIETPHLKPIEFHFAGVERGFIPKANRDLTRSATMEDLIRAVKIINKDF